MLGMGGGVGGWYTLGRYEGDFLVSSSSSTMPGLDVGGSAGSGVGADVEAVDDADADCFGLGRETWGPMKKRWKCVEGKSIVSCSQTCGGSEDSARAPRINIRTWGLPTVASAVSGAPVGTCRVLRRAASDLLPSGVSRWLLRVMLLYWCRTPPMVMGYVRSLLACLRDRSLSIDGKFRVYQNTSQFAKDTASSKPWAPEQ
jgi:hypothetical protein